MRTCLDLHAEDVMDALDIPIHIVDTTGTVIFVNHKWQEFMGISAEAAVGTPINQLLRSIETKYYFSIEYDNNSDAVDNVEHFDNAIEESAAMHVLQTKKRTSWFTYSTKNNKLIVTSSPICPDGQCKYVITTLTDITEFADKSEKLESEIKKNSIILNELKYYRKQHTTPTIVGKSEEISSVKDRIRFVSPTDASVLITGESGVGKEVFASELYHNSLRKKEPFVQINCASIPENLIESELFGYEKGAFTSAAKTKQGLFEIANNGTILLDEIGELPLNLQPKLLRVLQEQQMFRVGGTKPIKINVRVIATTNQDLISMVKSGTFRSDLYYRLNVIPIHIPPLRERKVDIPLLAEHFLDRFNKRYGKNKRLSSGAMSQLVSYPWPGNIRELENLLERLVIIGNEVVIHKNQMDSVLHPEEALVIPEQIKCQSLQKTLEVVERKIICKALAEYGSSHKAAAALGVSQSSIVRKAKKYSITW